jgi:formylglycine-generating enzyme required for sulfatase activity
VLRKIFINYRRVESVKDALHLKTLFDKWFWRPVFLDVRGIDGGADWLQTLERQVANSAAMVVLIGGGWADLKDKHGKRRLDDPDDFVRYEISQALQRRLPIIPVCIDGAAMPDVAQLPANLMQLSLLQAMPLRTESFEEDAQKIAERLKAMMLQQWQSVPAWAAGLGLTAALAAGVTAGPAVLDRLGLPFPGVALPGDAELRAELAEAQRAARAAQGAQQSLSERVATAEKERDAARKAAAVAEAKIADLERTGSAPLMAARERTLKPMETFQECRDCPEMMVVTAGKFTMGSPAEEKERSDSEGPQRTVAIGRPFAVGKFHVTRDQFALFAQETGYAAHSGCDWRNPGFTQDGSHPVVCVSWDDANAYAKWLTNKTGKPYRLLSEAEFEYAARAGTATPFWWGSSITSAQANYDGNYVYAGGGSTGVDRHGTVPAGSFEANLWGLYNVHGNAWQWTADCWHDNYNGAPVDGSAWTVTCSGGDRVARGGSWYNDPGALRAAQRSKGTVELNNIGFRLARTLNPPG